MAESKVHSNYMVFHFPLFFWLSHITNYQDMRAILHVVELELENLVTSWSMGMWSGMIIARKECRRFGFVLIIRRLVMVLLLFKQ